MIGPPGTGQDDARPDDPGAPAAAVRRADRSPATIVASVSGEGPIRGLVRTPPFRAPHHTSSYAAIVGGGRGLVARRGDPRRRRRALPRRARRVLARRPRGAPAAARGRPGHDRSRVGRGRRCRRGSSSSRRRTRARAATPARRIAAAAPQGVPERYVGRISGPLRDRIDVWVTLARMKAAAMVEAAGAGVVCGRRRADRRGARPAAGAARRPAERPADRPGAARDRRPASRSRARRLAELADAERLSGRGTERLLRVARTVADLDGRRCGRDRAPRGGGALAAAVEPLAVRAGGLTMLGVGAVATVREHGRRMARARRRPVAARPADRRSRRRIARRSPCCSRSTAWGRSRSRGSWTASGRRPRSSWSRRGSERRGGARGRERRSRGHEPRDAEARRDGDRGGGGRIATRSSPTWRARSSGSSRSATRSTRRASSRSRSRRRRSSFAARSAPLAAAHVVAVVGTRRPSPGGPADREPDRHGARAGRGDRRLRPRDRDRWGGPRGVRRPTARRRSRSSAAATRRSSRGRTTGSPTRSSTAAARSSPSTPRGSSRLEGTFPQRNRLISGSADAVVVVEAGARSGALVTASWALEQGRECFLVPGSIDAPTSAGCNGFLRDWPGARADRVRRPAAARRPRADGRGGAGRRRRAARSGAPPSRSGRRSTCRRRRRSSRGRDEAPAARRRRAPPRRVDGRRARRRDDA